MEYKFISCKPEFVDFEIRHLACQCMVDIQAAKQTVLLLQKCFVADDQYALTLKCLQKLVK